MKSTAAAKAAAASTAVGCPFQRGRRAGTVARIASLHVLQDALVYSPRALGLQLFESPHRSRLERGRDEDLGVGLGADGGADVAAVEHRAVAITRWMMGEIALEAQ